jgi:hypothetical protein
MFNRFDRWASQGNALASPGSPERHALGDSLVRMQRVMAGRRATLTYRHIFGPEASAAIHETGRDVGRIPPA